MSKDIIYREDAINLLWYFQDECCSAVVGDFEKLPSADRPQGKWKNYKDEHYCTNCGEVVIGDWYTEDEWYDFCPNCGCRMKGAGDE